MNLSSRQALACATRTLREAAVASPEVDARLLAAHILKVAPLAVGMADFSETELQDFFVAVQRRAQREPLQYITGSTAFGPCELQVGPGVFIPRPETEVLAAWAVDKLQSIESPVVVDFGTGSGALAIYIAHSIKRARVIAVEASAQAREYAAKNARENGVDIDILAGDMTKIDQFAELIATVDLVVSNPPYVPETPDLSQEVYWDPAEAVFSGVDGMDCIRGLVPVATQLLKSGGWIGIEHDDSTSQAVADEIAATGKYHRPQIMEDLSGRERFVTASKVVQTNTLL